MKISLGLVCVAATIFLLWVLMSWVREWTSQRQSALKVYMTKFNPVKESDLIVVETSTQFRAEREGSSLTAIDLPAFHARWP